MKKKDPWILFMLRAVADDHFKNKLDVWDDNDTATTILRYLIRRGGKRQIGVLKHALIRAGVKFPKRPK